MAETNPYDDKSQVKKFVLANYFALVGQLMKQASYAFILLLRAIGRLFLEAIGKR